MQNRNPSICENLFRLNEYVTKLIEILCYSEYKNVNYQDNVFGSLKELKEFQEKNFLAIRIRLHLIFFSEYVMRTTYKQETDLLNILLKKCEELILWAQKYKLIEEFKEEGDYKNWFKVTQFLEFSSQKLKVVSLAENSQSEHKKTIILINENCVKECDQESRKIYLNFLGEKMKQFV